MYVCFQRSYQATRSNKRRSRIISMQTGHMHKYIHSCINNKRNIPSGAMSHPHSAAVGKQELDTQSAWVLPSIYSTARLHCSSPQKGGDPASQVPSVPLHKIPQKSGTWCHPTMHTKTSCCVRDDVTHRGSADMQTPAHQRTPAQPLPRQWRRRCETCLLDMGPRTNPPIPEVPEKEKANAAVNNGRHRETEYPQLPILMTQPSSPRVLGPH